MNCSEIKEFFDASQSSGPRGGVWVYEKFISKIQNLYIRFMEKNIEHSGSSINRYKNQFVPIQNNLDEVKA